MIFSKHLRINLNSKINNFQIFLFCTYSNNIEQNYIYRYYNKLANSVLNGLSVKLIYKIVFLKNTRLRPLVKITINVSNFLTRYRTIVLFQEERNISGLLYEKNCQPAKPHVPSRFLKQFRSFCERLR